jgi:hypothetical protein
MKSIMMALGFVACAVAFVPGEANAIVCAAGVYHAGCAVRHSVVGAHVGPVGVGVVRHRCWINAYGRRVCN